MKQVYKLKLFKSKFTASDQRGQAAVEYVLLLVVIISMVMAAKGLFTGANTFINSYVGDYFVCLMDHGELPAQGISNSAPPGVTALDLKQHEDQSSKCKAKFSIANGATLTGGTGGTSGSSANSNANGNKSSSNKAADKKSATNANANSNTSTIKSKNKNKSAYNDSSGNGSSPYDNGTINKSDSGRNTADGDAGLSSKTKIIGEGDEEGSGRGTFGSRNSDRSQRRPDRYRAIASGKLFDEIEKNSKSESRKPMSKSIAKASVDEGYRPGPRKNAFTPPERKPTAASDDIEPEMGFAGMLKWLVIAGMAVAILVFFGGQIMNYSNSE